MAVRYPRYLFRPRIEDYHRRLRRGASCPDQGLDHKERERLLRGIQADLSQTEINLLLGRRQGLEEFERQLGADLWAEASWQDFFERQSWVFGYGLDYRIMRPFDREW